MNSGADLPAIRGALVVPGLPMQLPEYVGRTDPAAAIRERSVSELRTMLHEWNPSAVVVVAAQESAPEHTKGAIGVRVARVLLAESRWSGAVREITVSADASAEELDASAGRVMAGRTARGAMLLVPADLSARRTEQAPGYLDDRAAAFDAQVLQALDRGDAAALRAVDPVLAQGLWATGIPALQVLARVLPAPVRSEILWSGLPWGVQYVVARWWGRRPPPGSGT